MASPMSLTLPERWDSALIVGRTPWSARDALVPLLRRRIRHLRSLRSRPGGRLRTRASAPPSDADGRTWQSKWHCDGILRDPEGTPGNPLAAVWLSGAGFAPVGRLDISKGRVPLGRRMAS